MELSFYVLLLCRLIYYLVERERKSQEKKKKRREAFFRKTVPIWEQTVFPHWDQWYRKTFYRVRVAIHFIMFLGYLEMPFIEGVIIKSLPICGSLDYRRLCVEKCGD